MSSSPPEGFELRRPTREDAEAIARLLNEADGCFGLERPPSQTAKDVRSWWTMYDFDLSRDGWLALGADGALAAKGWVFRAHREHDHCDGSVRVHPSFVGRGLGSFLVRTTEERAAELGVARIQQSVLSVNEPGVRLLDSRGYAAVRRFFIMGTDVRGDAAAPEWPDGMRVEALRPELERGVYAAAQEAFASHWGFVPRSFEDWKRVRMTHEAFDASLWFVALAGDDVVGFSLCAQRYGCGVVETLGVRARWRRRGIARALLLHSFRELARRGEERVTLGVDTENETGATDLYERAGMEVEWESVTYEKELAA